MPLHLRGKGRGYLGQNVGQIPFDCLHSTGKMTGFLTTGRFSMAKTYKILMSSLVPLGGAYSRAGKSMASLPVCAMSVEPCTVYIGEDFEEERVNFYV